MKLAASAILFLRVRFSIPFDLRGKSDYPTRSDGIPAPVGNVSAQTCPFLNTAFNTRDAHTDSYGNALPCGRLSRRSVMPCSSRDAHYFSGKLNSALALLA